MPTNFVVTLWKDIATFIFNDLARHRFYPPQNPVESAKIQSAPPGNIREAYASVKDVISTALELDFTPGEAAHQVEVAINWGRYAALLAYDDTSEMLYLEASSAPLPTTC